MVRCFKFRIVFDGYKKVVDLLVGHFTQIYEYYISLLFSRLNMNHYQGQTRVVICNMFSFFVLYYFVVCCNLGESLLGFSFAAGAHSSHRGGGENVNFSID